MKSILIFLFGIFSLNARAAFLPEENAIVRGTWGGDGIRLELNRAQRTLEFDCAHGELNSPLRTDRTSEFSVNGTYTIEHGGPVRPGEHLESYRVRYHGFVAGSRLFLRFSYLHDGHWIRKSFGPLFRGSSGHITKCL